MTPSKPFTEVAEPGSLSAKPRAIQEETQDGSDSSTALTSRERPVGDGRDSFLLGKVPPLGRHLRLEQAPC